MKDIPRSWPASEKGGQAEERKINPRTAEELKINSGTAEERKIDPRTAEELKIN
jgi:hypothetical protein